MTVASLYSLGYLPTLRMESKGWSQLYHANYYFLLLGGAVYLGLIWLRRRVFLLQPAVDFALGILLYNALYYPSAYLLISGKVNAWTSLAPGLALLAYGWRLRRGRQVWSRLEL